VPEGALLRLLYCSLFFFAADRRSQADCSHANRWPFSLSSGKIDSLQINWAWPSARDLAHATIIYLFIYSFVNTPNTAW
jgi:hypothetical protein